VIFWWKSWWLRFSASASCFSRCVIFICSGACGG
jgi:hypothetical protein